MNLDDAVPEVTPGYETLRSEYPDIKKLTAKVSSRLNNNLKNLVNDGEQFLQELENQEVKEFMDKLNS